MGFGCHMGGAWVGAAGYADDLILLAPSRSAMKQMLKVCENYAATHNLQFSTDPTPAKSKTKCLYMCGYLEPVYPAPLQLCGSDLPWVEHATHLGHELHQLCSMEYDANIKKAQFIEAAVQIEEALGFANPPEILQAVQSYAGHWYGSMLWDLTSEKVFQIYRAWSTTVKLTWNVPRSTHLYLVDCLLAADFYTVKQQLAARFVSFFRSLRESLSPEVRIVANMVGRCVRSNTGKNLANIERETGLDPWRSQAWKVRDMMKRVEVPDKEGWRPQYLMKLLMARKELDTKCSDVSEISKLIESLCSS